MSIKSSAAIAAITLLSLAASQPASANDFVKFFQGLGVGTNSSAASKDPTIGSQTFRTGFLSPAEARPDRARGANRAQARNVAFDSAHTVRNWITNLMGRIQQGRADGRLSINESSLFMDQLNRLRAHEARLSSNNGLSRKEYGQLVNRISKIDNLLSSSLNSRKYTGGSKSNWY